MTEMEWVQFHGPLFVAGTNLDARLDALKKPGLKMVWDEDKKQLYVTYKGKTLRVPEANIAGMIEGKAKTNSFVQPAPAQPIVAQVSTPQSHVFGEGPGQTGQETWSMKEQEASKKKGYGKTGEVKL